MRGEQRLYLMVSDDGLYKVGISDNPERRRRQIQNTSGRRVTIQKCWSTGVVHARKVEQAIHAQYARRRRQGEWFRTMTEMDIQLAGFELTEVNRDGSLRYSNRKGEE